MARSLIMALLIAAAPLSAAAAQTAPAHDHAAHSGAADQPQQPATAPQGMPMGGMTGRTMSHDHAMMKEGQSCDCPCMKQGQGDEAATKKPPLHDHAKKHNSQ